MDIIQLLRDWFRFKLKLWNKGSKIIFKQRELWWCSLGINLGEEIFGKGEKFTRPVLIFKKFTSNSFLGLPLTSQPKAGSWYVEVTQAGKRSSVMLNQARVLDRKRLTNRIGTLDDQDWQAVCQKFLEFFTLDKLFYKKSHPNLSAGDQWENPKLRFNYKSNQPSLSIEGVAGSKQDMSSQFIHRALELNQDKPLVYTAFSKHYFYARMFISRFALEEGAVPLNPFMIFDYYMLDSIQRDLVTEGNNNLVKRADELWVFGPISKGVLAEIKIAQKMQKPVKYFQFINGTQIMAISKEEIEMEGEELQIFKSEL